MALQFILGNSGCGKTRYIHEKIVKEADANPKKNYFCVVPEQFTMQTQRELVSLQKNHCVMNIDIVSFGRLSYRVFDELGNFPYQVLEETGKNLILRRIAQKQIGQISVLKKNITKTGYIDEVKSLISELAQYNVTPQQLKKVAEELPAGSFSFKLKDIILMYQGFSDFLEDKFVTAEEVLELFMEVVESSKILKDSVIIFDGFTGFTPIQNQVFEKLLKASAQIYVTVTIDERENFYHCQGSHELFAMSKKMIASLSKMADQAHVEVEKPVVISHGQNSRFAQSKELFFLEQNLFRGNGGKFILPEEEAGIKISCCQNPRKELHYVAEQICHLIRRGFRYNEIAIVCGELSVYASYAREVFLNYDIPVFIDQKTTLVFHPFLEFLESLLEVIRFDFSYESFFRYLRSGLAKIPRDEVDILENYALSAGIRGYQKWSQVFSYVPKEYGGEELVKINGIRQKAAGQFAEIYPVLRRNKITVQEISQAVYQFILSLDVEGQLKEKELFYEQAGDLKNAKEYAQIYRIVMDLLDKMVELLGEEEVSLEEYGKILKAGLEVSKVGIIPPGYDRVVFGDIERTRLDDIKVLFFVGVNDGVIPKSQDSDGILSQREREILEEYGLELAPTAREKTFIQKFYLYLNLTKPSHKLYLSYTKVDGEGKGRRASYLVRTLLHMYENLSVEEVKESSFEKRILTEKNSLSLIAEGLMDAPSWVRDENEDLPLWGALCRYYDSNGSQELGDRVDRMIEASSLKKEDTKISRAVTKALYGSILENSVTRLEKFASCAFAHFLSYGLNLRERSVSSFAPVDMGNVFHEVLEIYSVRMKEQGLSWFEITKEESEAVLRSSMEEALEKNKNLALYENSRNAYGKQRMYRILKRTVWALTKQVRKGKFVPDSFEVSFAYEEDISAIHFHLSQEEKMHLRGRIDRIDTLEEEDNVYVKVIDYKSGNTGFQLLNIYYGLQLQLVVYMNVALEIMEKRYPDKQVVPAGVFYYHVEDPVIETDEEILEEELQQKLLKELKLDGVANEEGHILENMDDMFLEGESGSSDVIPVGRNKDGSIKKTSKTLSKEEFSLLSSYVNEKILHLGGRMLKGEIEVNPCSLGDRCVCDYCEYKNICDFDTKIPGYGYRKLEEYSQEEILQKMRGGAEHGRQVDR